MPREAERCHERKHTVTMLEAAPAPAVCSPLDGGVGPRLDAVMETVWTLVRSAPNFDGRERDVRQALVALVEQTVDIERARTRNELDVLAEYGGRDGERDWVSAGAWLRPGDVLAVVRPNVLVTGQGGQDAT